MFIDVLFPIDKLVFTWLGLIVEFTFSNTWNTVFVDVIELYQQQQHKLLFLVDVSTVNSVLSSHLKTRPKIGFSIPIIA